MKIDYVRNRIAARVSGVLLSEGLEDAQWRKLEEVWNQTHALIFEGQSGLSIEDQVAFLARFGPIIEERIPGEKHSYVSNAQGKGTDDMNEGYREGELTPHMDYTYTPFPADVISLYAEELPATGSKTRFFSNVAPLAKMPESLRAELQGYTLFCAHDLAAMRPDARLYLEGRTRAGAPTQSHVWPLLRSHPRKHGVDLLFATLQQTERIIELSDEATGDRASAEMLGRLFDDYLYRDENMYEHDWALGDLVVWDNLALQHARAACPSTEGKRSLRRVAVCEAGNAIHETMAFLGIESASQTFSAPTSGVG